MITKEQLMEIEKRIFNYGMAEYCFGDTKTKEGAKVAFNTHALLISYLKGLVE